jgi:hypothetical protein
VVLAAPVMEPVLVGLKVAVPLELVPVALLPQVDPAARVPAKAKVDLPPLARSRKVSLGVLLRPTVLPLPRPTESPVRLASVDATHLATCIGFRSPLAPT